MTAPEKAVIAEKIMAALHRELDGFIAAAKAAQAAATDPDSKAENKYDTRNLEASYLARGVAFRVVESEVALSEWGAMPPLDFSDRRPIGAGALVVLENEQGRAGYFIGPGGGGITVEHDGMDITAITAVSPLGRQLHGRKEGDTFLLDSGGRRLTTVIFSVS